MDADTIAEWLKTLYKMEDELTIELRAGDNKAEYRDTLQITRTQIQHLTAQVVNLQRRWF